MHRGALPGGANSASMMRTPRLTTSTSVVLDTRSEILNSGPCLSFKSSALRYAADLEFDASFTFLLRSAVNFPSDEVVEVPQGQSEHVEIGGGSEKYNKANSLVF